MFDDKPTREKKLDGRSRETNGRSQSSPVNWDLCTLDELLRYYDEIQLRLPPLALSQVSVEKELLLQFHTVRSLQTAVMDDKDIPVNQRAQVANSVAACVKSLADMQERVYATERFKNIENLLIRTLKEWPEDRAKEFLDEYEKILKRFA